MIGALPRGLGHSEGPLPISTTEHRCVPTGESVGRLVTLALINLELCGYRLQCWSNVFCAAQHPGTWSSSVHLYEGINWIIILVRIRILDCRGNGTKPGGNPRWQNGLPQHGNDPAPSNCEATVLTAAPPWITAQALVSSVFHYFLPASARWMSTRRSKCCCKTPNQANQMVPFYGNL